MKTIGNPLAHCCLASTECQLHRFIHMELLNKLAAFVDTRYGSMHVTRADPLAASISSRYTRAHSFIMVAGLPMSFSLKCNCCLLQHLDVKEPRKGQAKHLKDAIRW